MFRLALPALALFALGGSAALAQLAPEGGNYSVLQNGKPVGSAQYQVQSIPGGETLHASGDMHADKFSYSFTENETVDSSGNLVRDSLTGSVHGQKASGDNIQFDTASDASGRSFEIRVDADGKQTSNSVDRHRNLVLMPDLDPAAYALMAHLAVEHPQTAWVLIPKENGILVPADYEPLADLRGTLDGHSVTVKHVAVALSMENSLVVELFFTPGGDLLEADLNAQGLRVEKSEFHLLNRPKPVAPPANQAPAQGGGGAAGQSPQPQGYGQQPYGQPSAQQPPQLP